MNSTEAANRPNTLIVTELFLPSVGGVQVKIDSFASRLSESTIVLARPETGAEEIDGELPYRVFRVQPPSGIEKLGRRALPSLTRSVALARSASKIVSDHDIDIVQCTQLRVGFAGYLLRRRFGIPYVVWINETIAQVDTSSDQTIRGRLLSWRSKIGHRLRRFVVERSAGVMVASRAMEDHVGSSGLNPPATFVVHPATEVPDMAQLGDVPAELGDRRQSAGPLAISLGSLTRLKGVDVLLEAWPLVLRQVPTAELAIIGSGPEEQRLRGLAETLGVRSSVTFIGSVPREAVYQHLAAADVVVGLSRRLPGSGQFETFGQVFLQAAACSRPVVATRSGGIPDAVLDGVTGLLVDPDSCADAAAAMVRLFEDDELRRSLGDAGRRRVELDLNWDRSTERLCEMISAVAG